jgi:hypothetical protein
MEQAMPHLCNFIRSSPLRKWKTPGNGDADGTHPRAARRQPSPASIVAHVLISSGCANDARCGNALQIKAVERSSPGRSLCGAAGSVPDA